MSSHLGHLRYIVTLYRDQHHRVKELGYLCVDPSLIKLLKVDYDVILRIRF